MRLRLFYDFGRQLAAYEATRTFSTRFSSFPTSYLQPYGAVKTCCYAGTCGFWGFNWFLVAD